jgi:Zn-dependent protease with chaperone function
MRPRPARPLCILALLVLAGCAEVEFRAAKLEERQAVARVLTPLLIARYGAMDPAKCHIALGVAEAQDFNAWAAPSGDGPCDIDIAATAPAVKDLAPRMLQALLAHELGHVWSKHALGAARARETLSAKYATGQQSVMRTANELFTGEEEAEADALAARILTAAYRGENVGCMATADLYEGIASDRAHWSAWLSRHPFPERRVGAIVKACLAAQPGTKP